jgi:hypothetical protein
MATKIRYPIEGYAPGQYTCKCVGCGIEFMGDKRAVQCEPCAINGLVQTNYHLLKRVGELETILGKIQDGINEIQLLRDRRPMV